jgi:hypothetical protein
VPAGLRPPTHPRRTRLRRRAPRWRSRASAAARGPPRKGPRCACAAPDRVQLSRGCKSRSQHGRRSSSSGARMRAASSGGQPRSINSSTACRSIPQSPASRAASCGAHPTSRRRSRRHPTAASDSATGAAGAYLRGGPVAMHVHTCGARSSPPPLRGPVAIDVVDQAAVGSHPAVHEMRFCHAREGGRRERRSWPAQHRARPVRKKQLLAAGHVQ